MFGAASIGDSLQRAGVESTSMGQAEITVGDGVGRVEALERGAFLVEGAAFGEKVGEAGCAVRFGAAVWDGVSSVVVGWKGGGTDVEGRTRGRRRSRGRRRVRGRRESRTPCGCRSIFGRSVLRRDSGSRRRWGVRVRRCLEALVLRGGRGREMDGGSVRS
jgi:hypothetical protein